MDRPLSALSALREKKKTFDMTSEDIELCLVTFVAHDTLKQGLVRVCDLAAILESYTGETPRSEEVFEVRSFVLFTCSNYLLVGVLFGGCLATDGRTFSKK